MTLTTGTHRTRSSLALHALPAAAAIFVALLAAAATSAPANATAAATAPKTVVVYSVTKQQSFIDNADDRARGVGSNPFNPDPATAPSAQEGPNGPFAGDTAISFNALYLAPDLLKRAGSASIWCDFVFQKNAICKATIQLSGGLLTTLGPVVFGSKKFALAITGGTGKYRSARGELRIAPVAGAGSRIAQKFTFVLD